MPGTKIINVLKDDRFEDILGLFQASPAQEVIFVLPLKSKFLNEEAHFTVLAAAAEEQDKNILILSSNPDITELALKYNFGVLSNGKNSKKTQKTKVTVQTREEDEADEEEEIDNTIASEDAGDFDVAPENDELEAATRESSERSQQPSEAEQWPCGRRRMTEPVYGVDREAEADTGNFTAQEAPETLEGTEDTDNNISSGEDYQIVTAAKINRTLDDIVKPQEKKQVNIR